MENRRGHPQGSGWPNANAFLASGSGLSSTSSVSPSGKFLWHTAPRLWRPPVVTYRSCQITNFLVEHALICVLVLPSRGYGCIYTCGLGNNGRLLDATCTHAIAVGSDLECVQSVETMIGPKRGKTAWLCLNLYVVILRHVAYRSIYVAACRGTSKDRQRILGGTIIAAAAAATTTAFVGSYPQGGGTSLSVVGFGSIGV